MSSGAGGRHGSMEALAQSVSEVKTTLEVKWVGKREAEGYLEPGPPHLQEPCGKGN